MTETAPDDGKRTRRGNRGTSPVSSRQEKVSAGDEAEAGHVLIVDDDQATCELLESILRPQHRVVWKTSGRDALELVAAEDFDVILMDLGLTDIAGLELCGRMLTVRRGVPIVVVTGHGSLTTAVGAIRAGAYDFVTKPVEANKIVMTVNRAIRHRHLQQEVRRLRLDTEAPEGFAGIIGRSPGMRGVFDLIVRVSDSDATVLITGETGTGKERVAQAIHEHGARSSGPFVAINCAAMPASLLESELFGHLRGAFTDATTTRRGLFVEATGGTIFLDEIGELPLEVQPKLLRALQERKVRPIGSNREVSFDARIIAATNRNLEAEVLEKRFREDLYYRLNVVAVEVPPLRERGGDILVLAQYFACRAGARAGKEVKGLAWSAAEKLLAYDWPGNVRELENCLERAVAVMRFDSVTNEDLPDKIRHHHSVTLLRPNADPSELVTSDEMESRHIQRVLAMVGGNKSRAAKILGFNRRTLLRKLGRIGSDAASSSHPSASAESAPARIARINPTR